jgi:hypothetical protein
MASLSTLELLQNAQASLAADAASLAADAAGVERQRDALAAERAALEAERALMAGAATDSDLVQLNVGGALCCTQRRTLACASGSLLAAMFSGRWEQSLVRDADGRAFLDDDPEEFRALLGALRARAADATGAGAIVTAVEPSPALARLADNYLLRDHLWPLPFTGADVAQAPGGAAACGDVTAAVQGRALRVAAAGQQAAPAAAEKLSGEEQEFLPMDDGEGRMPLYGGGRGGRGRGRGRGQHQWRAVPVPQRLTPHALCLPPLRPGATWLVTLRALSVGAVLGVASSAAADDVCGSSVTCCPAPAGRPATPACRRRVATSSCCARAWWRNPAA